MKLTNCLGDITMENEIVYHLYLSMRDDYDFYLNKMGLEDNPISKIARYAYFNTYKTIMVIDGCKGRSKIMEELKNTIMKIDGMFPSTLSNIKTNNVTSMKLNNGTHIKSVKRSLDAKGYSISKVLTNTEHLKSDVYFDEITLPIVSCVYEGEVLVVP